MCGECDYTIASLDDIGFCTDCKTENGFILDPSDTRCVCREGLFADAIMNVCKSCDELIPGCIECGLTDSPLVTDAYTYVGYSPHISNG